jgi:hypothetical protein
VLCFVWDSSLGLLPGTAFWAFLGLLPGLLSETSSWHHVVAGMRCRFLGFSREIDGITPA